MTRTFDRLMIKAGFDPGDVERIKGRGFLYMGNLCLLFISVLFLAMLVL